ncbi:hypothetical protein ZIOFF_023089 [Zingiber officinale]|uniref:FHA domain-containing protein n=1 Tax=Zingiber officinale TaxID=94328 RepID=A0A8J5HNQ4_ZINOF|nr:hypothetical protein ZIOFF_023089 [Zingiber officinale]
MSFHSYILSLIEDEDSTNFKVVSSNKNVIDGGILRPSDCQVHNFASRQWESSRQFPHHYAMLGNAILLNGVLFVLGRDPDHLLSFDLKTRMWSVEDEELILSLLCFHLLGLEERLFLVGGLDREDLTITKIEIWEYDLVEKQWGMFCFMPDEIFRQFCGNSLFNFDTINQLGIVLFCNIREFSIIMFDMSSKIWSRAPDCEQPKSKKSWIGHALVPSFFELPYRIRYARFFLQPWSSLPLRRRRFVLFARLVPFVSNFSGVMKVPMGPPPPRNPNPTLENSNGEPPLAQHSQFSANQEGACAAESAVPESEANPISSSETTGTGPEVKIVEKPSPSVSSSCSFGSQSDKLPVPYSIPTWSEPPGHPFLLEVLKDGIIIEQLDVFLPPFVLWTMKYFLLLLPCSCAKADFVDNRLCSRSQKGAYMFGRVDLCDFVLEHPTISRFHAVLQFKKDEVLLYDLGSTHGTFVNKVQIKKKVYTGVHVGDVLRFGLFITNIMNPDEMACLIAEMKLSHIIPCQKLQLKEEELKIGADRIGNCLVAKVMSVKAVNRDTFKQHMSRLLQTLHRVEIDIVGPNIFVSNFKSATDRKRIQREGSWNFFNNLVIFKELERFVAPCNHDFDKTSFWVQCHNIPVEFMNANVMHHIGSQLGDIEEIDSGEGGNFIGRFARVRISLNITTPLLKGVSVGVGEGIENVMALFVYERLPDFCYACGRVGHNAKVREDSFVDKYTLAYMAWMRASSHTINDDPHKWSNDVPAQAQSGHNMETSNEFQGVWIAMSCPPISHLFFVDDSLIFFKAKVQDSSKIRDFLKKYEIASGQLINFENSPLPSSMVVFARIAHAIRSSRLYIFQGPTELMPPEEGDLEKLRNAKIREEMLDCEASLVRARVDASLASGISWGLQEDAIEEDIEDGADEITWQTYNGQLTERQEKTRSKIIKRMEKVNSHVPTPVLLVDLNSLLEDFFGLTGVVANMKKEIDAIRAKDIAQGGLTQGQQTQIGRNEQRISQIMEELENLEETLNESIQESVGARSRKVAHGTKDKNIEDEDEVLSDDDDFYDRTKKPSVRKPGGQQSVETVTADSLLERRVTIIKQIEEMKSLLLKEEKEKEATTSEQSTEREDDLDLYMSGLSSQLVHDRIQKIQNELSDLQAELDKTTYLLKIADPMGEASRKRVLIAEAPKPKTTPSVPKPPKPEQKQGSLPSLPVGSVTEDSSITKQKEHTEATEITEDTNSSKPVYTALKPQWLGATRELPEENMVLETQLDENELDNFVDYGDRNKALKPVNSGSDIKGAASGLIIRKGKSVHETKAVGGINSEAEVSVSSDAEASAVDAIALLLKHKRGLSALEEEERESKKSKSRDRGKDSSKQKRVLGPSRPDFLGGKPEYEAWVPPEGQTGDGRTSLNDRLGY